MNILKRETEPENILLAGHMGWILIATFDTASFRFLRRRTIPKCGCVGRSLQLSYDSFGESRTYEYSQHTANERNR